MQGEWFNAFFNVAFFEALHSSVKGASLELVVIGTRYEILTGKPFMRFQGAPQCCPSRLLIHLEILDHFYERCQRGICGHRDRQKESKVMKTLIVVLLVFVSTVLRSRLVLQLENVALRHQLTVYQLTRNGLVCIVYFAPA